MTVTSTAPAALEAAQARLLPAFQRVAPALARSLRGRSRVAKTIFNWLQLGARLPQVSMRPVEVNGEPGALFVDDQERLLAVWSIAIADGQITAIRSIVNPDKLAHLGPVGDFAALITSSH